MTQLEITTNIDLDPWVDLKGMTFTHGFVKRVGMLPQGMESGKAAVMINAKADDGTDIVVEISWAMFQMAYAALRGTPTAQMEHL